jgi:PAS domain S-box-containing protein
MKSKKDEINKKVEILVVEDSPTQAMELRNILEQNDYHVSVTKNGLEALTFLKKLTPEVIISDVIMPEMDGFELCQKIKEDKNLQNIPVIILTTLSEPEDIIRGLMSGADNFVTKPWREESILSRIHYVLANHDMRKDSISSEMGIEVFFGGKKHFITSDRMQILDLLFSTYEANIQKSKELININKELTKTQEELKTLNEQLEQKVVERTQKITHLNSVINAVRKVNQLIITENNPDRVLQGACDNLINASGFCKAWIAIKNISGKLVWKVEAGFGRKIWPMIELLKRGDFPTCAKRVLEQSNIEVIKDPSSTCGDCPLADAYDNKGVMCVRLKHNEKVYGFLSVSTLNEFIEDKEQLSLFQEVADDIALALHTIELNEKHEEAEEALRKSESSLAEAQQIANLGSLNWDIEKNEISCSDEAYHIFGITSQEFGLMTHEKFLEFVHPEDREFVKKLVNETLYDRKLFNIDFRILPADGSEKIVHRQAKVIIDEAGKPIRMNGTIQDITNWKQMEQMIIQSEKMASIGMLAAGIAHEINNPTGYIDSNLRTLETYTKKFKNFWSFLQKIIDEYSKAKGDELNNLIEELIKFKKENNLEFFIDDMKSAIEESLEGTEKVKRIVSDLKDFSRQEKPEMKISNINQGIEKTLNVIWNELKYKATVVKELGDIPQINCDIQKLNQVFMNVLINAVQAIEKQGTIKIKTYSKNNSVIVQISDTGKGISKEYIKKIFDPFFTTKEPGKGTGLGLSISYRIIKEHNGTIDVESEVGKGTTFTIILPINFS